MNRLWLAAGVLIALLTACGPAPASSTPSASASAAPSSASASASATASATASAPATATSAASPSPIEPAADDLAIDSLIEILVTDLVVRSDAGIDPPSMILASRMSAPDRAFVVEGPVLASGYEWYLVAPLDRGDGTRGPFGWIARASREGEAWVRPIAPPCPATADLAGVLGLQPLERLACYGDESLTLTASHGGCGAGGGPWVWEPAWLMQIGGCALALDATGDGLLMRVPPGVAGHDGSTPATVTGHFDDAAAAGCTVTTSDPASPAPGPDEAVVMCRSQFVVEP